jgi:nitrate reductase gamma subunit
VSSRLDILLWVVLPYLTIAVFAAGHVWRYRRDRFGWTAPGPQPTVRQRRPFSGLLFHYGFFLVLGGHVIGILVPKAVTEFLGLPEHDYHLVSVIAGTNAGVMMTAGLVALAVRRARTPRLAVATTRMDLVIYLVLAVVVLSGTYATVGVNLLGGGYDYRETIAPWFRGVVLLSPDASLVSDAPLAYQLHVLSTFVLYGIWPFSRLVHAWNAPLKLARLQPDPAAR